MRYEIQELCTEVVQKSCTWAANRVSHYEMNSLINWHVVV